MQFPSDHRQIYFVRGWTGIAYLAIFRPRCENRVVEWIKVGIQYRSGVALKKRDQIRKLPTLRQRNHGERSATYTDRISSWTDSSNTSSVPVERDKQRIHFDQVTIPGCRR